MADPARLRPCLLTSAGPGSGGGYGFVAGVTRHWVRHEHIWCDRMYVTIAPNVRNDIDVPSGMVMEMLPSELRSYGSIMWAHMGTCWPKLPVSASVRARLRSGRQSPLWQQRCPIGQSRTSVSSLDEISAAAPHSPRGQFISLGF